MTIESVLSSHVDEDTVEYISSLLESDPKDEDAREAVEALISGSVDDEALAKELIEKLFIELVGTNETTTTTNGGNDNEEEDPTTSTKKLEKAFRMKDSDVVSYASGLQAAKTELDEDGNLVYNHDEGGGAGGEEPQSSIRSFYANMIPVDENSRAIIMSEKARRKAAQKVAREKKAEEDRVRAIQDAIQIAELSSAGDNAQGGDKDNDDMEVGGNFADVHFRNFSLPNKKGSGADLLVDTNLSLSKGRRYGLMGRNGCGKTTFMEYMAQRQIKGIPKNMSMLLVRQEIVGNELTPVECVLRSDPRVEGLKLYIATMEAKQIQLEQQEKLQPTTQTKMPAPNPAETSTSVMKKLAAAYERLGQIEEEDGPPEPRARKILHGMGFTEAMQDKPTKELSGGWRMRVSLSNALFANPDLLLLDEPTNHLDLEAVLWLEKYLAHKYKGTVLVVSHDRHFLNEIVTDVVHFSNQKLTTYRGDIANYEAVLEENKKRQKRLHENQEAQREHLQKYIDLHAKSGENGVKAAKQRKSRMKKMDKLGVMAQSEGKKYKASYDGPAAEVTTVQEEESVVLTFPDPGSFEKNKSIVTLDRVSFGYHENSPLLLKDVDITIDIHSRIALLGRNGCGKSTLIKLIVGILNKPLKGSVSIDNRAKIEYLAQHQLEQLDPNSTPLETILERYPKDNSNSHRMELRKYLANFGLGGEVLPLQKINTMSGGQKCRLCLACAMYRCPHLLILDEPTNHLDLETTEALIESIKTFKGGILIVSHDQHLLTSVCKDLYVVDNGNLENISGKYGNGTSSEAFLQYKKAVIQGRR